MQKMQSLTDKLRLRKKKDAKVKSALGSIIASVGNKGIYASFARWPTPD